MSATELDAALDKIDTRYVETWQAEAGLKTYGQAVAEVLEFRTDEGERFDMTRRGMAGVLETRFLLRGPRAGEVDGRPRDLGLRAAQDPRRLLSHPERNRLCHRQVAGCGALRRHAVDGDQDGGPRGRQRSSRTPSTRSIPTRCWPTTSRRRSAGTPPA